MYKYRLLHISVLSQLTNSQFVELNILMAADRSASLILKVHTYLTSMLCNMWYQDMKAWMTLNHHRGTPT